MFVNDVEITSEIRDLILTHSGLDRSGLNIMDDTDLYELGMKSFASVQLMLALEKVFGVNFPDEMLNKSTFCSISAIRTSVRALRKNTEYPGTNSDNIVESNSLSFPSSHSSAC
jgi:acyl carrier protein